MDSSYEKALEAVRRAEHAVVHAQASSGPGEFQRAHNELMNAEQLVNHLMQNKAYRTGEERKMLERASEHLKHLLEAQDAIQ